MSHFLLGLKKSLICFVAAATSASMLAPVTAFAAETKPAAEAGTSTETKPEVTIDNHTQGRENAKVVSGITIGDVTAPKEGTRLDDKAVVTTTEGDTWEIPVIWIGENLKPDTGLAGKGSYLPVLAYVVPEQYTIRSNDATGRGYKITLSEDLLKLFGEEKIISIYENKTGITFILPAKLKDLYAQKGTVKNPTDAAGGEIVPDDQIAPFEDDEPEEETEEEVEEEEEEEPEEEEEEQEESYSHLVNVHCDSNAKKALTESDLEFLADLVVNILHPQAVNLLIEKFPAFRDAADNNKLGEYLTVIVGYEEGNDAVGYARHGRLTEEKYGDYKFVYSFTVNASELTDHKEDDKTIITRDFNSKAMRDLSNTIVHELFHCVSYDYNRPGLTGYLYTDEGLKDYTETQMVRLPDWFIEGTASSVENNWQYRHDVFNILCAPSESSNDSNLKKQLVKKYVDGVYHKNDEGQWVCDQNFDIEFCNGKDREGRACNSGTSRYVSGYLACMYLYELAAAKDPSIGSSRSEVGENVVFSSEKLRLGMNSIMERMHNGETMDQVINSISGGAYKDTAAFEALFIKGAPDPEDGKYFLTGDEDSVDFVYNFMNYMYRVDETISELNKHANGSVLFDFTEDFGSPLSYEGTYTTDVLKAQDDKDGDFVIFSRSTVGDRYAYSTGGKSMSGTPAAASSGSDSSASDPVGNGQAGSGDADENDNGANVLPFSAPSEESVSEEETAEVQGAAKETASEAVVEADVVETSAAAVEETDAEPSEEPGAVEPVSDPEPVVEENSDSGASEEEESDIPQDAAEDASAAEAEEGAEPVSE